VVTLVNLTVKSVKYAVKFFHEGIWSLTIESIGDGQRKQKYLQDEIILSIHAKTKSYPLE
jgi:hypothetical protein